MKLAPLDPGPYGSTPMPGGPDADPEVVASERPAANGQLYDTSSSSRHHLYGTLPTTDEGAPEPQPAQYGAVGGRRRGGRGPYDTPDSELRINGSTVGYILNDDALVLGDGRRGSFKAVGAGSLV